MPSKTIRVDYIPIEPVLDAWVDELAGFFVRGLKRKVSYTKQLVGFLLSNIRLIAITPPEKTRSCVLLEFLPTGFTVQEGPSSWRRKQGINSAFLVNFEDWKPLILEGAPQLDVAQRVFYGQWAEIKWSDKDIDIIPTPQPARFSVLLDPKHHMIELTVQQQRGS